MFIHCNTYHYRYKAVASCKWVDEVVRDAPYITSLELMDKYNCDFCVHGDDIVTSADGTDTYHEVKKAGRFRTVARTRGVSTTDLVGRMLLMTKQHHETPLNSADLGTMSEGENKRSPYTGVSRFSTPTQRIVQFSNSKEPKVLTCTLSLSHPFSQEIKWYTLMAPLTCFVSFQRSMHVVIGYRSWTY